MGTPTGEKRPAARKITKAARDETTPGLKGGNHPGRILNEWTNPEKSGLTRDKHGFELRVRAPGSNRPGIKGHRMKNGIITRYEYDESGNMTKKIEAVGTPEERITEYSYDGEGNLLSTRRVGDGDTADAVTAMAYDDVGNMISVTDPENNLTQFTSHDIMGNMLSKTDARGKVWHYTYNAAGWLKTVTDPLGNVTEMFYDAAGNRVRQVDAEGKETRYDYDAHGHMVKRTDALGNDTVLRITRPES